MSEVKIMLGNEAIARGAFEAGVKVSAAIIQIKDGMEATEEEINDFCLDLPRYKRPHKVIFADVPRNPTGKIEKPKLREMYGANRLIAEQNLA